MNTYYLCLAHYENAGDLLINKMLIEEIAKYGDVYLDCAHAPEDFRKYLFANEHIIDINHRYQLSFKKSNLICLLAFLKHNNIQLFLRPLGPIKIGKGLGHYYSSLAHRLVKFMGISYYYIGKCCSEVSARKKRINLDTVDAAYVRSYHSVEYIMQLGYNHVGYIPDLAFLYKDRVAVSPKKKTAVLTFREIKKGKDKFLEWLNMVVSYLLLNGYQVEFFFQVKRDEVFMKELVNLFDPHSVKFVEKLLWYDSFDYYADKNIVISNRLHSLLVGAVYDVIPLAYNDGNELTSKIKDVFSSSFGNWQYLMEDFSSINNLTYIIDNCESIRHELQNDCLSNANKCQVTINGIVRTINRSNSID